MLILIDGIANKNIYYFKFSWVYGVYGFYMLFKQFNSTYFDVKINVLNKQIEQYRQELLELEDNIRNYERNKVSLYEQLESHKKNVVNLESEENILNNRVSKIDRDSDIFKKIPFIGGGVNALLYGGELDKLYCNIMELKTVIKKERKKCREIFQEIEAFDKISIEDLNSKKECLLDLLSKCLSERDKVKNKSIELNNVINPIKKELSRINNEIFECMEVTAKAQALERALIVSKDNRSKAEIHKTCDMILGDNNPSKVIDDLNRKLGGLTRSKIKLEERINREVYLRLRKIDKITIDGNNLMYDNGVFIGHEVLLALIFYIHYVLDIKNIDLFFDNSILYLKNDCGVYYTQDRIESIFGNCAKVYITTDKADEWIINSANEPRCYIISNDRFVDYFDKKVVKFKRIFQFKIENKKISVLDLGIEYLDLDKLKEKVNDQNL